MHSIKESIRMDVRQHSTFHLIKLIHLGRVGFCMDIHSLIAFLPKHQNNAVFRILPKSCAMLLRLPHLSIGTL